MIRKLLSALRPANNRRNPSDPAQAYLIARAEAKRARRAEKLDRDIRRSWVGNSAHDIGPRLDPLYLAR